MCLAIPGKVTRIEGLRAEVAYPGQTRPAFVGEKNTKVGDFVLVQMGIIIKVLNPQETKEAQKAWA